MTRPLLILVALLAAAMSACSSGSATRMASFEPYDPRPTEPYDQRGWHHPGGYYMQSDDGLTRLPYRPRKPRPVVRQSDVKETVGRSEDASQNGSAPRVVNTPEWLAKEAAADDRVKQKMIICRGC
jgi:hypothetical protein